MGFFKVNVQKANGQYSEASRNLYGLEASTMQFRALRTKLANAQFATIRELSTHSALCSRLKAISRYSDNPTTQQKISFLLEQVELGDEMPLPTEALDSVTCIEGQIYDQRRALNQLKQQLNKPRILRGWRSSEYLKNRFDNQVKTLRDEVERSATEMQSTTNRFHNYTAMVADANRILRSNPVRF